MQWSIPIRLAHQDEFASILSVDDDASRRYATGGMTIDLSPDHPFIVGEQARWKASLLSGDVFVAEDPVRGAVGIAILGWLDAEPYLDQLSVRLEHAGRGVGSALIAEAVDWARRRGPGLWLNTYGHLPWNRPFYERRGFVLVEERLWRPEMRAAIEMQRASLPRPDQRVVMFRTLR